MNTIFTSESVWFDRWDDFLKNELRGTHLQNSNWLNTYKSYGFNIELFVIYNEHNEIFGGFMAVIAKKSIFKFYIIPQGPIVKSNYEFTLENCFQEIYKRSKMLNCCYAQFSIPISNNALISRYVYMDSVRTQIPKLFRTGKKFNYIYSGYGMNWVDLSQFTDFQDYLNGLKSQVRRNIKLAFDRNDSTSHLSNSSTQEELKDIYNLVTMNAQQFKYSVREFKDLSACLLNFLKEDLAVFQRVYYRSEIVSSGFSLRNSDHLIYLFGGTKRIVPDIKAGYLIHACNIKTSIKEGKRGYNISMGGSQGVREFKQKFNSQEIYFEEPHYYCVHNAILFNIFQVLDKHLKKHKALISKFLKGIK